MKSRGRDEQQCLVIGLDCGTSGVKAIAFDRRGRVAAHAHVPIPLFSPHPNQYEQNPGDWWDSARRALRAVVHEVDPCTIVALAVSNQRETFVALDREGACLRPAILWLDERCKGEVKPFAAKIGEKRIHRTTGKPPDYAPVVYRLAWLKRHEPDLYSRIAAICDVHTYLVWKLTGSMKTSWASADPLGLFDLKNKRWSSVILDALELQEEQLPEAFCPGTVLGMISAEGSRTTGLCAGTLIVAGGGDGQCAGLGSGVLTSKRAYLNLGTAVVAGVYGEKYRVSTAFRTMASCSTSGYYYESSLRAGTFAIEWFVRKILEVPLAHQLGIYRRLEQQAQRVPPGSDGLLHLPYLCGAMNPHWDVDARGAFVGLASSHHRGHIYRSVLEGIAFEQRLAMNAVEHETGITVRDFVTIGGGAASRLWCTILADITGRNICIPRTTEASALGAAIAAAIGAGWYRTFKEATRKMTGIRKRIAPNADNHRTYQALFERYRAIYPALKKIETKVEVKAECKQRSRSRN